MIIDQFYVGQHHILVNEVIRPLTACIDALPLPEGHSHYVVDIGASDGLNQSNSLIYLMRRWAGLCLDANPKDFARWQNFYQRYLPWVQGACVKVTPENILSILSRFAVPQTPTLLCLDIDSFDYPVLEALLREHRPLVICAEVNESIPPPLGFFVHYSPEYRYIGGHFYGMSLNALRDLGLQFGYVLVELCFNNAILIRADLSPPSAPELSQVYQGFSTRPNPLWNQPMQPLQRLSPEQGQEFLREYFAEESVDYTLYIAPDAARD